MSLSSISNNGYSFPGYQAGQSRAASFNAGQGANANLSSSSGNATQVTLSNSALALKTAVGGATGAYAANGGQAASSDIAQEEGLLGGLAETSLAALGILSPAQEAGAKISFDSVSYNVSSSISASSSSQVTQQGQQQGQSGVQTLSQSSNTQEADFTGEGTIVTADGRSIKFQIELQLDQSEQFTSGTQAQNTSSNDSGTSILAQQQPTDLATQLLNSLSSIGSSAGASSGAAGAQASQVISGKNSANALSAGSADGQANQAVGSTDVINWDAILKQSESMIDMLNSLVGVAQTAAGAVSG